MGAREIETRRRRRLRREALELAEREWCCGGPLLDPRDIDWSDRDAASDQMVRIIGETSNLGLWFVRNCLVRRADRLAMAIELHHHLAPWVRATERMREEWLVGTGDSGTLTVTL